MIILGLVDLLFLSFVIVQVPYLFGGMDLVQSTPDFKLADYARRGFGELVAVAALVLPMLLVSHWLLQARDTSPRTHFPDPCRNSDRIAFRHHGFGRTETVAADG